MKESSWSTAVSPPPPWNTYDKHRELYYQNRFLRSITLQNIIYSKNMIFKKL
jgi:hypothetical protein